MIGQSSVGVNAASENAQRRTDGRDTNRKNMESSWVQMNQRSFRQEKGKCRNGRHEESKMAGVHHKMDLRGALHEKVQRHL